MARKKFQAQQWLDKKEPRQNPQKPSLPSDSDIEIVTRRIEKSAVDITCGYSNWRDLGFALSDELGESGRSYFHRISRFNSGYNEKECNKQYDRCLQAHGTGITIKTFFQAAKDNGISIVTKREAISANPQNPQIRSKEIEKCVSGKAFPQNADCGFADLRKSADFPEEQREKQSSGEVGNQGVIQENGNLKLSPEAENDNVRLPTFTQNVKGKLPNLLEKVADVAISEQDSDMLILGAMTVISACLPHVYGVYADRPVYPNLFLFVTANASSGKGRLTLCRSIVEPIHTKLRDLNEIEMADYKRQLAEYNAAGKKKVDLVKPEQPPMRMLFIPANSSATAVYQVLNDNNGCGLMFETEGDTLANTFGSDYGNYSDGFRKAFHHEPISYIRRKDREYVDIKQPKLSTLLTGTPRQILNLITDAENGLFSRFIFYVLNLDLIWNDVFVSQSDVTLDVYFQRLGSEFHDLYKLLKAGKDIRFSLTEAQRAEFNRAFEVWQRDWFDELGNSFVASVRRLGVVTFRLAMILTTLRIMDTGDCSSELVCSDEDFKTAMEISGVVIRHNALVFRGLPAPDTVLAPNVPRKEKLKVFYDRLPAEFDRRAYSELAQSMELVPKSIDRVIRSWCESGRLLNPSHGRYIKV